MAPVPAFVPTGTHACLARSRKPHVAILALRRAGAFLRRRVAGGRSRAGAIASGWRSLGYSIRTLQTKMPAFAI